MNGVHGCIRTADLAKQDLALLVNGEDTSSCALGCFFESDGADQGGTRVAKKGVRKFLLRLESSVGFG